MAAGVRLVGTTYIVEFDDGHVVTIQGSSAKISAEKIYKESIGRLWGLCSCGRYEFQDLKLGLSNWSNYRLICYKKCQRKDHFTSSTGVLPSYIQAL